MKNNLTEKQKYIIGLISNKIDEYDSIDEWDLSLEVWHEALDFVKDLIADFNEKDEGNLK